METHNNKIANRLKIRRRLLRGRTYIIVSISFIVVAIVTSALLTRPSRISGVPDPARRAPPPITHLSAWVSIPNESLRKGVDGMLATAVRQIDSSLDDALHLRHRVTYNTRDNTLQFMINASGEVDIPVTSDDLGLSLSATVQMSPRVDTMGYLRPGLGVNVHRFMAEGRDRTQWLAKGGDLTASVTIIPFVWVMRETVSTIGIEAMVASAEQTMQEAVRDAAVDVWNDLCDAFALDGDGMSKWLLVRPVGLQVRQVEVTPLATSLQFRVDIESRTVDEDAGVQCPFPRTVSLIDTDLFETLPQDGLGDESVAFVALDLDYRTLGELGGVVLDGQTAVTGLVAPWLAERMSIIDVRVRPYDRGVIDGIGGPALLLEVDVAASLLGGTATGTIFVAGVPEVANEAGEMRLDITEIDTESGHPLLSLFLKMGKRAASDAIQSDDFGVRALQDGFVEYLAQQDLIPESVLDVEIREGTIVGIQIGDRHVRVNVEVRGAVDLEIGRLGASLGGFMTPSGG